MRTARQPTRLRCEVQRLNPESLANILTAMMSAPSERDTKRQQNLIKRVQRIDVSGNTVKLNPRSMRCASPYRTQIIFPHLPASRVGKTGTFLSGARKF